jgi:hypothetical protein
VLAASSERVERRAAAVAALRRVLAAKILAGMSRPLSFSSGVYSEV